MGCSSSRATPVCAAMLRVRYEKAEKWAELAELLVGDADVIAAANPDVKVVAPEPPPRGASPASGASAAGVDAAAAGRPAAGRRPGEAPAAAADIHLLEAPAAPRTPSRPRARGAARPPRSRAAPGALRRLQRRAARPRRRAGPREGHRLVRQPAHQGAGALPPPPGARRWRSSATRTWPWRSSTWPSRSIPARSTCCAISACWRSRRTTSTAPRRRSALLLQRLETTRGSPRARSSITSARSAPKQGDRTKAVQMFERAIENDPALERAPDEAHGAEGVNGAAG